MLAIQYKSAFLDGLSCIRLSCLNRFNAESIYSDGDGLLDQIDGNHKARLAFLFTYDSSNSVQAPPYNADPLPDIQECVRAERYSLFHNGPDCVNLLLRDWDAHPSEPHKTNDSCRSKHAHSVFQFVLCSGKNISGKERNRDNLLAVAPTVTLIKKRQEAFYAFPLQFQVNPLLVASTRAERIPGHLGGIRLRRRAVTLLDKNWCNSRHSSANLSPTQPF